MPLDHRLTAIATALLLGALPIVAGHGHDAELTDAIAGGVRTSMDAAFNSSSNATAIQDVPTFFRHPHHGGWMFAHIGLMLVAWAAVLPLAIMLSIARSRYHLPVQVVFHVVNGIGMSTGFAYRHSTPDLYPSNTHNPIGWIVTSFTVAWTLISLSVAYGEHVGKTAIFPSSGATWAHNNLHEPYRDRFSRESGRGSERSSIFRFNFHSRQNSTESICQKEEMPTSPLSEETHEEDVVEMEQRRGFLGNNRVDRFISKSVLRFTSQRVTKFIWFSQICLEKVLLLLGFLAIATGFVVYGGVFRDRHVFTGLAHFVKGGIFFWYGVLTLGRWMGAFSEFGWAWNVRPAHPTVTRWKTRVPSAEFTESFVIWLYGASNAFLEHVTARGKPWSSTDLEHLSITMLFFGGGLLGMLIESSAAQRLADTAVELQKLHDESTRQLDNADNLEPDVGRDNLWEEPATRRTSLNPLPALTIMLLGLMMSSHHQSSMVSTMIHAQWGSLFCGFAFARAVTYILMFIRPPQSHFASRPPSELVAAFCLMSGGLLFMVSARDTVEAIENNGFEAMAIFTVTLGLTGLIMAWEVTCFAVKGWALRRERAA